MLVMGFGFSPAPARAQHEGDVIIARTPSLQLVITGFDTDGFVALPPVSGLLNGWSDNGPGFDHLATANPGLGLFPLAAGAQIRLEVVSIDPAFRALGPGLAPIVDDPGEGLTLGDHQLHEHVTWHINSTDPDYDPLQCEWLATFILLDLGTTGYADSDPFTLRFVGQAPSGQDCNGNGRRDACDVALGSSNDCNANGVPDECDAIAPCGDGVVCTCDRCVAGSCVHLSANYGDVTCNGGLANLDDILCVLGGFAQFGRCPNGDLAPLSSGNGIINLDDILAVLAAFGGNNPC